MILTLFRFIYTYNSSCPNFHKQKGKLLGPIFNFNFFFLILGTKNKARHGSAYKKNPLQFCLNTAELVDSPGIFMHWQSLNFKCLQGAKSPFIPVKDFPVKMPPKWYKITMPICPSYHIILKQLSWLNKIWWSLKFIYEFLSVNFDF